MYRFKLSDPAAAAFVDKPCCDGSHSRDTNSRRTCSSPKGMYLWPNGSYAIVHYTATIDAGYIVQPACADSLALLERKKEEYTKNAVEQCSATEARKEKAMPPHLKSKQAANANTKHGITASATTTTTTSQKSQPIKPMSAISPATRAALSGGTRSKAVRRLEEYIPISITTSSNPSEAAINHGIFPKKSAIVEAVINKGAFMPGAFPFETQVTKGNRLGAALKEAADSCTAAKASEDAKRTAAAVKKQAEKSSGAGEDGWEMVEDDDFDGEEWEMVGGSR
ncbi:hypothetical protein LTR85_009886 [Meristemomyces frigidus]|nr:hypothetical protein LTR85_009886 [Meristemomyces frigidus]